MSRGGRRLYEGAYTPYHAALAAWLGEREADAWAALAMRQVEHLACETEDGWLPLSAADLAADLRCSRQTAARALAKLVDRGLLERRDDPDRPPRGLLYQPRYPALRRVPRLRLSPDTDALAERIAWADALDEDRSRLNSDSIAVQSETRTMSQTETPDPHQERDRGPDNGSTAAEQRREEQRKAKNSNNGSGSGSLPPPSPSLVDAARAREAGGGGDTHEVGDLVARLVEARRAPERRGGGGAA